MQFKNPFKSLPVLALALLLAALLVLPAAAQGPGGDVSIQAVDFTTFLWNPPATSVARGDGAVLTRLDIQGAQQISGFTLAIGYDASIIAPDSVEPGDLLPGTRGVDYFMTVTSGGGALQCGGDSSFMVTVAYLNPAMTVNGSGSLLDITWRSDPDAAVNDVGTVCLDGTTSLVVDNGGVPSVTPVPSPVATITIDPPSIFKFQIGLEGGQNSGLNIPAVPDDVLTQVTINGIYPCDGGGVDPLGFCTFNNATTSPPYSVSVNRAGYLSATANFTDPGNSSSVWLLAGDLNNDNVINIFDIQLMASLLGSPVGPPPGETTLLQSADYTGPGNAPDGLINIQDLVLMAKNFGVSGPTDGSVPSGTFPF